MPACSRALVAVLLVMILVIGCATPEPAPAPPLPTVTPLAPMTGSGGGRIAYGSYLSGGTGELWVMNADGTGLRRLTTNSADDTNPAWSPDGTSIAFHSSRLGRSSIYVMNVEQVLLGGSAPDTLAVQRLTTRLSSFAPAWSPDGLQIAFVSGSDSESEIRVMNVQEARRGLDGSDQLRLTQNDAADTNPAWSPDGRQIAFASDRDGDLAIYVMDVDGSDQRRLIRTGNGRDDTPVWSPDGLRLAFSSARNGRWAIYVANADGTDLQRLSPSGTETDDYAPVWSPDGSRIVFQSSVESQWDIFVMNADGTDRRRLTISSENDYEPAWGR